MEYKERCHLLVAMCMRSDHLERLRNKLRWGTLLEQEIPVIHFDNSIGAALYNRSRFRREGVVILIRIEEAGCIQEDVIGMTKGVWEKINLLALTQVRSQLGLGYNGC